MNKSWIKAFPVKNLESRNPSFDLQKERGVGREKKDKRR